jgi:hypothetical protein
MDDVGLTERALIDKHLVPLLNARETRFFQHNGKVTDLRTVAALGIRKDALDMAFRLRGSYAPKDPQIAAIGVKVVLTPGCPRPGDPDPELEQANGKQLN